MYLNNIKSDRLEFRGITEDDIPIWTKYFENNKNLDYLGLDQNQNNKEQAEDWVSRQILRYKENRYGLHSLIEKRTGIYIGQCGLVTQDVNGINEVEIGYHIMPEYWGMGYATEAARRC